MEYLVKATPNRFEEGDFICANPDGFEWARGELDTSVFRIIKNAPDITDSEESLLQMEESNLRNNVAMLQLPAFRHTGFDMTRFKTKRMRRYKYNETTRQRELKEWQVLL